MMLPLALLESATVFGAEQFGTEKTYGAARRAGEPAAASGQAPASAFGAAPKPPPAPTSDAVTPAGTGASQAAVMPARPSSTNSIARNKAALPRDLFKMDDRAIIIVGGKNVAAGDVKRELNAELKRATGPAKTFAVPARAAAATNAGRAGLAPAASGASIRDQRGTIGANARSTSIFASDADAAPSAMLGGSATAKRREYKLIDCNGAAPEIASIGGRVAAGEKFTIDGWCFGKATGGVELIGQFSGGMLKVAFAEWTDDRIVAVMPAVRGAADHAVAISVVRSADRAKSAAMQRTFYATRERVDVPPRYWTPESDFVAFDIQTGGGDIFTGFRVWGKGVGSFANDFRVSINPACALDTMEVPTQTGRVLAVTGWENGPPHESVVQVAWSPVCVTQTTNYVFASSSQRICSAAFTLRAWAYCPVGVAP